MKKLLFPFFVICLFAFAAYAGVTLVSTLKIQNNIQYTDNILTATSQSTNYTLNVINSEYTCNLTANARLYILNGNLSGIKQFVGITFTNNSGGDLFIDHTNTWISYNIFTNRVATGKSARIAYEIEGNNVRYSGVVQP